VALVRVVDVDDDGTGTTGTIHNNAWLQLLNDSIDTALAASAPATSAPTTTGTVTAEPIPAGTGDLVTYHTNATLKTIQGMVAGLPGQRWTHVSKGAGQVDFAHLHASGTALGKCKLFATTGLTSLAAGSGVAVFQYDATVTQWRLVSHEQGAWITPTFAAGNYTANAGTWTLAAGDVVWNAYRLTGRTLEWAFRLATTSVSNAGVVLSAALPGGFTAAGAVYQQTRSSDNGAAVVAGFANIPAAATAAQFTSTLVGVGYAISTNATEIAGRISVELQ